MKVEIRPLEAGDAETSVRWRNTPEVWAKTRSAPDHVITLEEEQAWIARVMADETRRSFAILADGEYVGNTYLTGIGEGVAEFHAFIGEPACWGKGIGREALNQLIDYARDELGLTAIDLEVREDNAAAFKLYQSVGFVTTGMDGSFTAMRLDLRGAVGDE